MFGSSLLYFVMGQRHVAVLHRLHKWIIFALYRSDNPFKLKNRCCILQSHTGINNSPLLPARL